MGSSTRQQQAKEGRPSHTEDLTAGSDSTAHLNRACLCCGHWALAAEPAPAWISSRLPTHPALSGFAFPARRKARPDLAHLVLRKKASWVECHRSLASPISRRDCYVVGVPPGIGSASKKSSARIDRPDGLWS